MNNQLSAAEAQVLLHPNRQDGGEALRLFLIELAARGALTVRREGWRKKTFVGFAQYGESRLPSTVFARAAWAGIGGPDFAGSEVPVKEVVNRARLAFGSSFSQFRTDFVIPALVGAHFITTQRKKVAGLFPKTHIQLTATGEETARYLERQLRQFKNLRGRYDDSPQAVAGLVSTLGAAILLSPDLRKHHRGLDAALKGGAGRDGGDFRYVFTGSGDSRDDSPSPGAFDFGSFSGIHFGGLGEAFGGFDGAIGDGGSGGDGGDGGGGGGD